ncbi:MULTISPECIES: OsmC family protein [unclassified Shewanella]|uniref:OsmC family protein n=1 Tax=unclassified Shewanella TaxID=196818 RepID=UPI001BC81ADF|nr:MULTISPECIES: OsmC family protein [unclassified Shewanella]GIU09504.1 peroxiredoxin [Shewanella sp. MBTL60-112-B1]GIU34005.1 peroxiredoxin [Shewanella sp. MBTL60-112-B2]
MSFKINLCWTAPEEPINDPQKFCRDHQITFGSGQQVNGSSAPEYSGNPENVNPEESLLAALSSCHMLTFLTIAHLKRLPIVSYQDNAYAELGKNSAGKIFVSKIVLNPKIEFSTEVEQEVLDKIHEKSHSNCFIANSLSPETVFEIK